MATGDCFKFSLNSLTSAACMSFSLLIGTPLASASDDVVLAAVPPAERPEPLSTATREIREGHPADAQARLEVFLKDEPKKSPYRAEGLYLRGQSLAAQNKLEEAKKELDRAIDATDDRTLKALAMFGRADCNLSMRNFSLASRQYHWLETMYRDVKALPQDELMYKLAVSCKHTGATTTANYWFKQILELYATGPYAEKAKLEHTKFTPTDPNVEPRVYTLLVSTFSKIDKAEVEAAILREKEYRDVQIVERTVNSFQIFEIHVGKFIHRNDAVRAQTDAELAGLPTSIRPSMLQPIK